MSRFTQEIKRVNVPITVIILSAGIGSRIKSYEPRALLKMGERTLLEHQIYHLQNNFHNSEITVVVGNAATKIIKRVDTNIRIIENQLYENTNSFESLRLAINNIVGDNVLFLHGDLIFNQKTFEGLSYDKSFVLIDKNEQFSEREVGITQTNKKVNIFSYGLPTKWCQIAYITGREFSILKQICHKNNAEHKKMLTFEALNKIINKGGQFFCYEPPNMKIKEIDCMRDFNNENFNI